MEAPPAGTLAGHGLDSRFLAALEMTTMQSRGAVWLMRSSQGMWLVGLGIYMGLSGNIDRLKEPKVEKSQGGIGRLEGGPGAQNFSPSKTCNPEH